MARNFLTIDDVQMDGKTVLLRVDINSPIDPTDGKILDDTRMRHHIKTIKDLRRTKLVLLAHQSRPGKTDYVPLDQHARHLQKLLGQHVHYVDDLFGSSAKRAIKGLRTGEILLLENTRFYAEEVALSGKALEDQYNCHIVQELADLADFYINDAFAASHRLQPTLVGFADHIPCAAGRLMEKELTMMDKLLHMKKKPRLAVLGGAKVDDTVDIIENMMKNDFVDKIITTGVVANVFITAEGYDLGKANMKFLHKEIDNCVECIGKAGSLKKKYGDRIDTPDNLVINENGLRKVLIKSELPTEFPIYDIGLESIAHCCNEIEKAASVVLNGPAGVFEMPNFALGTVEILNALGRTKAFTVAGGGHTAATLAQLGLAERIDHVSTGGGALIQHLSGKTMPVVEALKCSKSNHDCGKYCKE